VVCNIISDSIAKDVGGIWHTNIIPFPGINITRLSARIEMSPSLVSKPFTIFHVGTNDIVTRNQNESYSVDEIISFYNNLITLIRRINPKTHIVFSSILPRPCDYSLTKDKVKQVNILLEVKCKERQCQFLHSYRPFFKFGRPDRSVFAVRDGGLHLNLEGTRLLRKIFIRVVSH
jgi:lysophospholipase L1-like esterase